MNINSYNAYFIENKEGQNFIPENELKGSIGFTLDSKKGTILGDTYIDDCNEIAFNSKKFTGILHATIKQINKQSLRDHNINFFHEFSGLNLTEIMHAFIVTHQLEPDCLGVCEANQNGVVADEIKFGDPNWTSMILFIPRKSSFRDEIMMTAKKELKPSEEGQLAKYAFGPGFKRVIQQNKPIDLDHHKDIISWEVSDLIKNTSIRDKSNKPKDTTCAQLATRVLRASELISAIPDHKLIKYKKLDKNKLQQKLIKKMNKENSSIGNIVKSSALFKFDASREVLPYELFLTLFEQSTFHKF